MDNSHDQFELPLPFPELSADEPLLPARMVNEYVYCPRLAYLQWVQGEWQESADTIEGRHLHQRVDKPGGELPAAEQVNEMSSIEARSITLSSNRLGVIARLDLIENEDDAVVPVDYKHGKRPHTSKGAWEPERVQLCLQGMLLREHGYRCDHGILYFAGSRERVHIPFDDELVTAATNALSGLRLIAQGGHIPPPLEDSPKCPRCALVGICLPDEINYLNNGDIAPRPLAVPNEGALPVYVQAWNARVGKRGERLEIHIDDETVTARLAEISQLVLMGNPRLSTPALHELMRREIPVSWHSYSGWFIGHTHGTGHKNVEIRTAQYKASFDDRACLHIARRLIHAKIMNARTLLRRNWRSKQDNRLLLKDMQRDASNAAKARGIEQLLGFEGAAASRYFQHFRHTLRSDGNDGKSLTFDFEKRNRRPPADPVNALLSFAYALLTRSWTVALSAVGLDPYRGFYHQPRYGRPALALDMMEPYRPIIADSVVIQAINNGEVRPTDFKSAAGSVMLAPAGKKRFIATYERRMAQEITHPEFGYRLSYQRLLEVEARLLARHLLGETPQYKPLRTR